MTDTDDVNVALKDGQPIAMVLPDKDGLGVPVMPNMVSLIANAPHPADARQLIDYLLSPDVERQLAQSRLYSSRCMREFRDPKTFRRSTRSNP